MIACGLLANHGIVKGGEMSPKVEDTVSIAKLHFEIGAGKENFKWVVKKG